MLAKCEPEWLSVLFTWVASPLYLSGSQCNVHLTAQFLNKNIKWQRRKGWPKIVNIFKKNTLKPLNFTSFPQYYYSFITAGDKHRFAHPQALKERLVFTERQASKFGFYAPAPVWKKVDFLWQRPTQTRVVKKIYSSKKHVWNNLAHSPIVVQLPS